jgi:hypothetical protein
MTDDVLRQTIIGDEHRRLLSLASVVPAGFSAFCSLFGPHLQPPPPAFVGHARVPPFVPARRDTLETFT